MQLQCPAIRLSLFALLFPLCRYVHQLDRITARPHPTVMQRASTVVSAAGSDVVVWSGQEVLADRGQARRAGDVRVLVHLMF